ncbi:MAG TPA: hypothetical protein VGH19_15355 [Verrucomicrobiae bacterium]
MAQLSPDQIADIILSRRSVYGLDTDSRIRQVANQLTARALFELLAQLDDQASDFPLQLSTLLLELGDDLHLKDKYLISFDTGNLPADAPEVTPPPAPEEPSVHYLKLIFQNEDAAYYQFHFFPDLETGYILGAARKRTGDAQHIRLELTHPSALQTFIESCRSNPHFLRVEESTAEQFRQAPSHGT